MQINLPIGLLTLVAVQYLLPLRRPRGLADDDKTPALKRTLRVDWVAGLLVLGSVTSLMLALTVSGIANKIQMAQNYSSGVASSNHGTALP